jgi:hypothetical protein
MDGSNIHLLIIRVKGRLATVLHVVEIHNECQHSLLVLAVHVARVEMRLEKLSHVVLVEAPTLVQRTAG